MAFLKFPDKDPEEVLDYTVDFSDLIAAAAGTEIASATVEQDTDPESPNTLNFVVSPSASRIQLGGESVSPLPFDGVVVWLSGGTVGVTYQLKVTAIDSNSSPVPRTYVRRATVKVKQK